MKGIEKVYHFAVLCHIISKKILIKDMTMSDGQVCIMFLCTTQTHAVEKHPWPCWWPACERWGPKHLCYLTTSLLPQRSWRILKWLFFRGQGKGGLQGRLLGECFFAHLFPSTERELSVLLASLNLYLLNLKGVTDLNGKLGKDKADTHGSSVFFSFLGVYGL